MPELTREQWERVQAIYTRAAELPETERSAYVDSASDGDDALRREVESLLQVEIDDVDGFLARPPRPGRALDGDGHVEIDRYRIVRRLGAGGMGVVYLAERTEADFEQTVAIKVLRRGLGSPSLARRLRRERQVLADLEHPGIARLIDGGETRAGDPFLAMEYVEGRPIDDYCEAHDLDRAARLRLVLRVGEAIAHAHRKLVIHRDLKPGNILVDANGVPRVIDFGIALPLTLGDAATMHTNAEEILGTLAYMSPEQCQRGAGAATDVRSDVYALGVVVHELLTGRRPHDLTTMTIVEAIEVITRAPVPRPSLLEPAIRGDLETILLKALVKDPECRYQSIAAFMDDLERYLAHEPIAARPPSVAYLARKFYQRDRVTVALVAMASVALLLTATIAVRFGLRAERERQRADARSADAEWRFGSIAAAGGMVGSEPSSFHRDEAGRYLRAAPEHLRGWEWSHLDARRTRGLWEARTEQHALSVEFAPAGDRVVVAHDLSDGHLTQWDPKSGAPIWTFADGPEWSRPIQLVTWSPDGRFVATACSGGAVQLWASNGRAAAAVELAHPGADCAGVAFSSDAKRLVTAGTDGTIAVWEIRGNGLGERWRGRGAGARPRRTLAFTTDGEGVVVGDDEGALRLLDAATGAMINEVHPPDARRIVAVRAVGDRVLALDYRTRILTFDGRTLEHVSTVEPDDRYATAGGLVAAAISRSGRLVAREHQSAVVVLEAASGDVVAIINAAREKAGQADLSFSPDERRLALACRDSLQLHMLSLPALPAHWPVGTRDARSAAFDSTSSLLALGDASGAIEIRHVETDILVGRFQAHQDGIRALAFAHDDTTLLTASLGALRWWDARRGALLRETDDFEGYREGLALDPTRRHVAYAARDGLLRIVDALSGQPIEVLEAGARVRHVAYAPDGRRICGATKDEIVVWTLPGYQVERRIPIEHPVRDLVVTPVGAVVACFRARQLYEWPPGVAGPTLHRYLGRVWNMHCLDISADGLRIASGASDSGVRLWDVARMTEVMPLREFRAPVGDVCFSPDQRYVVACVTTTRRTPYVWTTMSAAERLPAMTVRSTYDEHDGDWPSIRSAVESDIWLDDAQRAAALAIVDRLAWWFDTNVNRASAAAVP